MSNVSHRSNLMIVGPDKIDCSRVGTRSVIMIGLSNGIIRKQLGPSSSAPARLILCGTFPRVNNIIRARSACTAT